MASLAQMNLRSAPLARVGVPRLAVGSSCSALHPAQLDGQLYSKANAAGAAAAAAPGEMQLLTHWLSLERADLRNGTLCPGHRAPAARPVARRSAIVAKAQEQNMGAVACATALALTMGLTADVQPASADVAGLTPCSESKAYNKLERKELKTLEKRLKKVNDGKNRLLYYTQARDRAGRCGHLGSKRGEWNASLLFAGTSRPRISALHWPSHHLPFNCMPFVE
eukprot:979417-Pelagomonas_calceolata.AAC.4